MLSYKTSLFLLFLAVHYGQALEKYRGKNFDVLIFTQRWPQTICHMWKESSPSHTCALPRDKNEWTIHGIWPSVYGKIGPLFCDRSLPFDKNALLPFENELREKWIDIEYGRDSYGLWQHEWEKHGTCAVVLGPMNNEAKYFQQGLSLSKKYDMKNVLAQANIVPGGVYTETDIFNAVRQVLGKRPTVVCRKDRNTGQSYIMEIRLCLNKMLQLIDCDGVYEYPTNCDPYGEIIYPSPQQGFRIIQA